MILWKISPAISIKHRILATFNIKKKFNSDSLYAFNEVHLREEWSMVKHVLVGYQSVSTSSSWKNKHIDGFYTKTTQKGGFSKICVKIKKRCYTDLLHFSTCKHNLVYLFGRIVFINKQFRTCANAFPNEFVWPYEYCAGKHWILYWI
jgi:hypothetical protein